MINFEANFDTNMETACTAPPDRAPWQLNGPDSNSAIPPFLPLIAQPFGNAVRMSDKTLCMIAVQGENDEFKHYDVHNLYGWSQTGVTLE